MATGSLAEVNDWTDVTDPQKVGDWEDIAPSQQPKQTSPKTWSEKLGMTGPILGGSWNPVKAQIDLTEGAVSGLASTAFKGGDLIRRGLGMKRVIDTPEAQRAMTAPPTMAGQVGLYGEQAAEFAIPLSGVAKAARALPLAGRMAAEGAASGGIAALQSGGDPTTTGIAAGIGAAIPGLPTAWGATKVGVKSGRAAINRALLSNTSWEQAMEKALKPASTNLNFKPSLGRAMRDLKGAEVESGKSIATSETPIDDLLSAVKDAKRNVWSQYEAIAGPQGPRGIDLTPVAEARIRMIPAKLRLENPEAAAKLAETANKYRGTFTIQEAEEFLKTINAELESYYAKYPSARTAAATKNPDTASLVAEAEALRDSIYKALDDIGEGAVPRQLKQRYGALMNVEREVYRRANVAARQAPNSLSEQVGKWRGAGRAVRGAYRLATGDPSGAGDLLEAGMSTEAARALKETNTTNELLRHAFREFKGAPYPTVTPRPFQPAGLLPPGGPNSFRMPAAPDTSFVRGVPAEYGQPQKLLGPGGGSPAAPKVAGAAGPERLSAPAPLETPAPIQAPSRVAPLPAAAKTAPIPAPEAIPLPSPGPVNPAAPFSNPVGDYVPLGEDATGVHFRFTNRRGAVSESVITRAQWDALVAKGDSVVAAQPPPMSPGPIMQ